MFVAYPFGNSKADSSEWEASALLFEGDGFFVVLHRKDELM